MSPSIDTRDPRLSAITIDSRDGLSSRGRAIAWVLAILLLVTSVLALAAADALPISGARAQNTAPAASDSALPERLGGVASDPSAVPVDPSVIEATWDGPAVNLDWTGAEYARAETTFIGDRVAAPGDRVVRTLNVVNAGPGNGVATVTIDLAEVVPEGAQNPNLADDVTLFWDIAGVSGEERFSALVPEGRANVAEIAVPQGDPVQVTVGFEMDAAVETSRALGADSTVLSFDVGVELTGETEPPVIPTLSVTGATGILALIGIAIALLLIGWLLLALRRRTHRCDDCDREIARDEERVEYRDGNGAKRTLCAECNHAPVPTA
ncbi:TraR/DksA family transcriptional regulator [Leucobacter luti]|uniref:Uncharacterized protein n=2 Tax=Leucobacter luti TaxID=340320 RepID=A0A4Q7TZQ9_9MICO|nr:TraR/DksA family transcriptional regulator [Leucobacter luti]RZT66641.1 hypothetical protein EV139_0762 [Leucobacter luti]